MKKNKPGLLPTNGFMDTAVVGERGQIVIPKELRDELHLISGSRVVFMRHHEGPVLMCPVEFFQQFVTEMNMQFAKISPRTKK